jgi:GNAT superfamily N-acetyltransferase
MTAIVGSEEADVLLAAWSEVSHDHPNVDVWLKKVHGQKVELAEINANPRGQGFGTAALNALTELADMHGVFIVLYPEPSNFGRLEEFYNKFGFVDGAVASQLVYEPRALNNTQTVRAP